MDRALLLEQADLYVLGLLDSAERAEFDRLLRSGDRDALAALVAAEETVARLALLAPLAEPPPLVRSQLMNSIRPASVSPPPAAARPRRAVEIWAWAATAAAIVAAFLGYRQVSDAGRELASVRTELAAARSEADRLRDDAGRYRRVMAVLRSPEARMVRLASTAPETPQFRAFWSGSAGVVLTGANVARPREGRTLQLWVVPKTGNPVSAGVFEVGADGSVLHLAEVGVSAADSKALAISDEPVGGSPQPTTTPAWVGAVGD